MQTMQSGRLKYLEDTFPARCCMITHCAICVKHIRCDALTATIEYILRRFGLEWAEERNGFLQYDLKAWLARDHELEHRPQNAY